MAAYNDENLRAFLQEMLQPVIDSVQRLTDRVDGFTDRVDGLTDRVDGLTDRVDGLTETVQEMRAQGMRMECLIKNSLKSPNEALEIVPNREGNFPDATLFPPTLTINHLLVAGNERIPATGEVNTWSKSKSVRLLDFYDAGDGYNSETENEYTPTANASRLRLAKVLGVSASQIQQCSLSLLDV
jgi:hypothetical protein